MGLELRGLLGADVVADLVARLADAPWADGRATAHGSAREAKANLQLEPTQPLAKALGGPLIEALSRREDFKGAALPHTLLPFTFARYDVGMTYGDHLDLPVMSTPRGPLRSDLSLTVFLSDPSTYDGGELVLSLPGGEQRIKGGAGDAFLYASNTVHRVEPVRRGVRLVAITWIQSLVGDPEDRALVADLGDAILRLQRSGVPEPELLRLRHVQHRLLRRWAVC
jgi:PKHD-type hydroxylase